ncbi:thioesterase II family protein [Paenibacillus sp. P22]|uniref:thioesterase II family protein n=1 Tax=Paenibacillus sp. P22 TaxID=483908 RepID=UPI0003FF4CD6|nr:thioesterase domain-containing protein [Paenibacillus sp. P22]
MSQNTRSDIRLFCFPFAGAGASFYNGWNELLGDSAEVVPIQLPGRERQIAEEPYRRIQAAADDFARMIEAQSDGRPAALFGHCFLGATMAFEVASRLETGGKVPVLRLFVSAASSPGGTRSYSMSSYDDDRFLEEVAKLTGYTHHAFSIPDLRELLMPALRADFEMDETYAAVPGVMLKAPITALYAAGDSFVSKEAVERWEDFTTGGFKLVEVQGEHMYITGTPEQATAVMARELAGKEGAHPHG